MGDSDTYDALKLRNQLCFPVYLCAKEITQRYAPFLEEIDLTYTQYIVMMYFWEKGESNMKEAGKALLLDPSTLTPLLNKLEKKGYITKSRSKEDERNLVIRPTEKGYALREKAKDIPEKMGKCLKLSPEEAKTLYNLTYRVIANIEKERYDKRNN